MQAQLNMAATETAYSITFDATVAGVENGVWNGTGFQPSPSSGRLNSNAWASTGMNDGALAFGGTQVTGDYSRGTSTGGETTGGFYAYEVATGDFALGAKPSGTDWTPGTLTLRIQNTSGSILTSMDLAYEIWVNNGFPRSSSFNLSYSTNDVSYTTVPALNYTSPTNADGNGFTLTNRNTTITGLSVANNGYIYLRWSSNDVGGNNGRDELALDDITVTGHGCTPAVISSITSNSPVCSADALQLHVAATGPGLSYLWTGTGTFSPNAASADVSVTNAATGNYAVTVSNSCNSVSANINVIINPSPTGVSATSSTDSVCASSNLLDLTATGSMPGATILSQNFNSGIAPWTTTNTSTGGTPANASWTLRADGYNVSSQTFHSNDASQFVMSNSDAQGNGSTTATTLISPAFSTMGFTAASLGFHHYFRYNNGETAYVEVSTDGSTWTTLQTFSSTQGSAANFTQVTINLNSYLNQATVYLRFRYAATWDWYWAIDNVSVTGNGTPSFAWTSTPAGFTSNVQNPTGVAVTQNTVFTVTATSTNGCTVQANTGTITYLNPSATISYPAGPHAIGSGTLSVTQTGTTGGSYSATPAGLALNATTGEIDLATSSAGTYTVTYGANTPCPYSTTAQVVLAVAGCMDPVADNYNASATIDDASCSYCVPTITYNAPTPTPITIGSGIPDQNMAVSQDCRGIDVALNAFERYVGPIIPVGNVYTTTTGHSPTSGSNPTPDPVMARWNLLGSIDLGTYDFTQVNVFLDLDFDPNATPVWHTLNLSQSMIANNMGALHVYQASENLASPYWAIVFPSVTFDPNVPGTYDIRVRLESAFNNEAFDTLAIKVVVNPAEITYYSQANGNVSDAIWDVVPAGTPGAATFGANANVVVQGGHTVTNTTDVDVRKLTVAAGGTLALNGNTTLTVHGDSATFGGTVNAAVNSTLKLAGTEASKLGSSGPLNLYNLTVNTALGTATAATLNISGTLQLDNGDFDPSLGTVILTSAASGTGRLGPVAPGASYTGNITVQRYIPAGHTNWRMLGSAVAGQTVNNWQDDFITAGYPGSQYPNFDMPVGSGILWPSIRFYDEANTFALADSGVAGVSANTQALAAGQGFLAWSGDNFNTTQAFTVDVTGAPTIAQSPLALPMSFTSSGTLAADGWNLVANPLPSPIDFTLLSRGADVENAYWIFDPVSGNSLAWTNGVGQGGLNGKIQSSQGFWVKADGSNVATTIDESAKVNQPGGGTFGGDQDPLLPILNLSITGTATTYSDQATLVFAQGTPAHDGIDALKMTFKTNGAPQIGVMSTDGQQLAVDFFGSYSSAIQIPLKVDVDVTGTYTITAGMAGINGLSCLSLTDLQTGTVTPLTDGAAYSCTINANADANITRFVLNGSAPIPFYNEAALCHDQEGRATVVVDAGPMNITWTDVFGNVLLQQTVEDGTAEFDALAGNYQVHITPGGACGELATDFTITAPDAIGSDVLQTATSCPSSTDGSVEIATVTGGTAPYTFLWNTGATANSITGAAGSYSATITDAAGCTSSINAEIPAGEGAIAQFSFSSGTLLVNTPVQFTNSSVLADNYTWDFGDGSTSTESDPAHTYSLPGTYTVTLTANGGACTSITTQQITVELNTAIASPNNDANLAVWATQDHLVIAHPFGSAPVDVDVYDATGRLALGRSAISHPERFTLDDRSLNTGVWFVRVTSGEVQRTFRVPLVR